MESPPPRQPGWKKLLLSAFICFHWACVAAWLWPNPSDAKRFLMGLQVPIPVVGGRGLEWRERAVVPAYLFNTAQHQDWAMFAPNPLQINRYVAATVTYRSGREAEFSFPRLSQLGGIEAWIEKRYRKYQHRICDENVAAYREDLARFIARRMVRSGDPPVRVRIYEYRSAIPRHDRFGADARPWVDYIGLLRDGAAFQPQSMIDYRVRPGDLR